MKKPICFFSLIAAALLSLVAMHPTDVLTDTGVTMNNIQWGTLANLRQEGKLIFQTNTLMRETSRRIPASARVATVCMLGKVVRSYVESASFKQAYRQSMREQFPVDETYSDDNVARHEAEVNGSDAAVVSQMTAMQQAFAQLEPTMLYTAIQMQLRQQETELAGVQGSERQTMARNIAEIKRLLAVNAGKPAEFKKQYLAYQQQQMKQSAQQNVGEARTQLAEVKAGNEAYRQQKAALDAHSDFLPRLRNQLQTFITLCNNVDFEARLMPYGSKREFVNPTYRNKPAEWKLLYRIGKEPVMAARDFAQSWLADLSR
jgi:hypothetical protein